MQCPSTVPCNKADGLQSPFLICFVQINDIIANNWFIGSEALLWISGFRLNGIIYENLSAYFSISTFNHQIKNVATHSKHLTAIILINLTKNIPQTFKRNRFLQWVPCVIFVFAATCTRDKVYWSSTWHVNVYE